MIRLNHGIAAGNLTRDPYFHQFSANKAVSRFTMAVNSYDDKGEEHTSYVPIIAWDNLAEVARKFLRKGMNPVVEYVVRQRKIEGKTSDDDRWETQLVARRLHLPPKPSNGAADGTSDGGTFEGNLPENPDQEIPF